MVQHGSPGMEKGWSSALLRRLQEAEHEDQERFIPFALNTGSAGKHVGSPTLFHHGF